MKLLCDENIGTRIPYALRLVELEAKSSSDAHLLGADDIHYLTAVSQGKFLGFSTNKEMLNVPEERDTIVNEKVGIVFVTRGDLKLADTLQLMLNKWNWLETIDMLVPRPFVYFLHPSGQTEKKL
jgi:hypothetical protein